MTSERPYCGAHAPEDAAAELRAVSAAGRIDAEAVERNVQHVYTKIGVSTRGTAALFAIESGVVAAEA